MAQHTVQPPTIRWHSPLLASPIEPFNSQLEKCSCRCLHSEHSECIAAQLPREEASCAGKWLPATRLWMRQPSLMQGFDRGNYHGWMDDWTFTMIHWKGSAAVRPCDVQEPHFREILEARQEAGRHSERATNCNPLLSWTGS
jgi:hypothetical protein